MFIECSLCARWVCFELFIFIIPHALHLPPPPSKSKSTLHFLFGISADLKLCATGNTYGGFRMWRKLSHFIPAAQGSQMPPQSSTLKSSGLSHHIPPALGAAPPVGWGGPGPQGKSTGRGVRCPHRPTCGSTHACTGWSLLPWRQTVEGTVTPPSKIILNRGRFNKAERELNQLLATRKADFYEAAPWYAGLG